MNTILNGQGSQEVKHIKIAVFVQKLYFSQIYIFNFKDKLGTEALDNSFYGN